MVFHLKAFLVTCSFKTDINDASIKWVCKYLANNSNFNYTVVEHGESGVAHLHSIFYTEVAKNGSDIKNQFWKALDSKQNDNSIRKYAIKVNVCHDQTWHDEYLKKEADCTIITDEWPTDESVLTEYYPDAATQKALQAIGKAGYARSDCSDMLEGYQSFLDQYNLESTYSNASGYYLSYNHQRNRTIAMKQLKEVPMSIHNWASARVTPFESDLAWAKALDTPKPGVKRQKTDRTVYNALKEMSFKKPKDASLCPEEGPEFDSLQSEQEVQENCIQDEEEELPP